MRMIEECAKELFLHDVRDHVMEVQLDQGVHRCIRFAKPNSGTYSFTLVTGPGFLLCRGDMGDYCFERLQDMFEFFRQEDRTYINPCYWAEKCVAGRDEIREFSTELASLTVAEAVAEWPEELREAAIDEIASAENTEDFIQRGCEYRDSHLGVDYHLADWWEAANSVEDYKFRFIWCLRAIVWGIAQYDKSKTNV